MKVAEQGKFSLLGKLEHELLCVVNGGVQHFGRLLPSAVQVTPSKRAPVVPINHAIRIQHWDNLEDKMLAKKLSFQIVRVC